MRLVEQYQMSRVRACRLVGLNRSSLSYQRPDDSRLRQRLRELAAPRRRFGYRRLGSLLAREGRRMNRKKLYRLYREEKLMVRRRGGRKRAVGTRANLTLENPARFFRGARDDRDLPPQQLPPSAASDPYIHVAAIDRLAGVGSVGGGD